MSLTHQMLCIKYNMLISVFSDMYVLFFSLMLCTKIEHGGSGLDCFVSFMLGIKYTMLKISSVLLRF